MKAIVLDPLVRRRELIQTVLARRDHDVTIVEGVSDLIELRRSSGHQLLFLAASLVRREGLPLSQKLHLPGEGGGCAILAIDDETGGDPIELLAAGVDDVLPHPLDDQTVDLRTAITEHRLRRGQRRERWFETLIALGASVFAVIDSRGIVQYVSPNLKGLSPHGPEEIVGESIFDLVSPDDRESSQDAFRRVLSEPGRTGRFQVRLRTRGARRSIADVCMRNCLEDSWIGGIIVTATDVTKQQEAENALAESEERHRLIAENVSDVIWTRLLPEPIAPESLPDRESAVAFASNVLDGLQTTYVSPSVTRMLGYSVSEAAKLPVREVLTERSFADLQRFIAAAVEPQRSGSQMVQAPVTLELEYVTKSKGTRWGEITGNFLWDEQGRVLGSLVVTRDVTERKRVEKALQESELRLRRLIENMPDFVILVDEHAEIKYVNRGVAGLQPDALVGQRGFGFLLAEHHDACEAAFAAALATGKVQYVEARDIFGLLWSCRLVPLSEKGFGPHVMIICTDVTKERRAFETVRKEQDLLRQLIELHERDRKVLAFELHDGFAQQLTGAMMSLEAAARLTVSNPEKASAPLDDATRLLRESIAESRRLVSGLRPPVLDQFGIVAAVEHLVSLNHCDEQLQIDFVSRGRTRRLAAPLENAVFRIVQETLANIRQHSGSRKASVEVLLDQREITVSVRDWGVGFEPQSVRETCFGLRGIRERARLLGGTADIQSAPGEGTTIRVSLPMIESCPDEGEGSV